MNHLKLITSLIIVVSVIFLGGVDFASAGWTTGKYNSAIDFNGSSTYVNGFGAIGNIKSVSFWIKADSTTEDVIDLNGAQTITIASGTISANSFTSPTIYVDGKVSSTLPDTDWHHIAVTTDTNVNASAVVIGKVTSFFDGKLDDVKIYAYARTADEIRLDYNAGVATHLGPSGKTCSEDPAGCMDYGLVGSWGMDEGTGTTAYDGSDEGNDGTLTNGPKWTTDSSPLAGGGGSLEFDGVDDYVDCGSGSSLDVTSAITIEAWIYISSHKTEHVIVSKNYNSYEFSVKNTDEIRLLISTSPYIITTATNLVENTWYHVVGIYNSISETGKIYVNGQNQAVTDTTSGTIASNPANKVYIGSRMGNGLFFNGFIDSVRIYNRALSAEEVRYHYNKGGPVAEWGFDEGSGTVAYDATPNNNDGTLTNMDDSDWVEGKYGGALEFDGVDDYVDCGDKLIYEMPVYSWSMWIKGNSAPGTGKITQPLWNADYQFQFSWDHSNPDFKQTAVHYSGSAWYKSQIASTLSAGAWYYISATYDGTNIKIYLNGNLEDTNPAPAPTTNTGIFAIGGTGATNYFNGSIDSVRIYNYARTPSQIQQDYNAGVATHFR